METTECLAAQAKPARAKLRVGSTTKSDLNDELLAVLPAVGVIPVVATDGTKASAEEMSHMAEDLNKLVSHYH